MTQRRDLRTFLLKVYGRLPPGPRQRAVRLIQPSYTLGVIPVITSVDGEILLVRHSYSAGWGLPGGLVNRRERVESALVREALEEVGVDIVLRGPLTVCVDPTDQVVRVVSRAELAVPEAIPTPASAEIIETRWFATDSLPELVDVSLVALEALRRIERS